MNIRTFNQCVKNCLWITAAYFSIYSTSRLLSYLTQKPKKHPFLINNRLYLYNNFIDPRESIVAIGHKAIRDPLTSQILINPIVKADGLSYESDSSVPVPYENRTLKEFIASYSMKSKQPSSLSSFSQSK